MEMMYYNLGRVSYQDSLQVLEADIQHANALAAAIPTAKGGTWLQMKLVYNHMAPIILFLLQWLDCSCTCLLPRYFNLFSVIVYKEEYEPKDKLGTLICAHSYHRDCIKQWLSHKKTCPVCKSEVVARR